MIYIIDGFHLNKSTPIDSRIVASGSTARDAIEYKYDGLRVFDTYDSKPYVWNNGTWVLENESGVTKDSTSANYIPKLNSSNVIGNSIIYQDVSNSRIGIKTTTPTVDFEVNGSIKGTNLIGDGSNIKNVNVSTPTGKLPLANLHNGTSGHILRSGPSVPTYTNPNDMTIGYANNVNIQSATDNTNYKLVFATGSNTASPLKTHTTNILFNPSTGKLLLGSNGTQTSPVLSISAQNSGFYKVGTDGIGITTDGKLRTSFDSDGSKLVDNKFDTSPGSLSIGTGTQTITTGITISSVNYDRIVYVYSEDLNDSYFISGGNFHISIFIDNAQIYSNFSSFDSSPKSFQTNYCFILPAGKPAYIKYKKSSLSWSSGTGPTFYTRLLRFGLNSVKDI